MNYTEADAVTLAAKLEALDLTDSERALLEEIVTVAAGDDEVAGHSMSSWYSIKLVAFTTTSTETNFAIQSQVSDQSAATSARSQAQKKLEDSRKAATDKWKG